MIIKVLIFFAQRLDNKYLNGENKKKSRILFTMQIQGVLILLCDNKQVYFIVKKRVNQWSMVSMEWWITRITF